MPNLVSPNEMLEAAREFMLEGRKPETHDDWALVMNFFAYNISAGVVPQACELLRKIFEMPLSEQEVKEIIGYQLEKRMEAVIASLPPDEEDDW